jgi:Zn-dependent M28 family amino/carboxypeptidase
MSKKARIIILILCFISTGFTFLSNNKPVTADDLREWVEYLSSDKMNGRANGSPEMKKASEWIASRFRDAGLVKFKSIGGYIQEYDYKYQKRSIHERNVIGYIEGSDPFLKNEYLVITAHFDHIGISDMSYPDSICNGADDNAAGTATIIGIAENILNSGKKPGRSIIFAAFSGEEHGMRGSRFFVQHSPVDLNSIYADLNFEMTGHSEFLGTGKYYMTGCKNSNLDDIISNTSNKNFKLVDSIPVTDFLFNSSDNISFSKISVDNDTSIGIPSGTFATTAISNYLHTVTDESKYCDFNNMSGFVSYFSDIILTLSNSREEIYWTNINYRKPGD